MQSVAFALKFPGERSMAAKMGIFYATVAKQKWHAKIMEIPSTVLSVEFPTNPVATTFLPNSSMSITGKTFAPASKVQNHEIKSVECMI